MTLCCYAHPHESNVNWEAFTACGTIVLAVFTILLAIAAIRQLIDVKEFFIQNKILNQVQSSESIIIKQMEFHHKLLDGIQFENLPGGRASFKILYQFLNEYYAETLNKAIDETEDEINNRINMAFSKLYKEYCYLFGNYYKNLYLLIKYIDELPENPEYKKDYYINLVTAQLSRFEILLLAYDCIWIYNDKRIGQNFMDYASKHNLFSSLETSELMHISHKELFTNRYKINFDN
jgi:hypothetical protein